MAQTIAPGWLNTMLFTLHTLNGGVVVWMGVIIGLWRWRFLSPSARFVTYYFLFWAVEAIVDLWSRRVLHTNIYLFHISVLVETWLLGLAYYHIYDSKTLRRIMPWAGGAFTLIALADAFWINGLNHNNTVARAVQVPLMLVMVLLYFEQWMRELRKGSPWDNFMFLVSAAVAVYYTTSIMSYLNLDSGGMAGAIMGIIIEIAVLIRLLLMIWALWQETHPKEPKLRLVADRS